MMMRNILRSSLALFVMLALFGITAEASAQTEAQQIRQMLEQRDQQIKSALGTRTTFTDAQRNRLKSLINDAIDFEAMGRFALGSNWNDLNAQQRQEYVAVFSDVVRAQSLSDLDIYRSTVRYDNISVDGNRARVSTTTTHRNTSASVAYDLQRSNGQWLVTDIILDGTSTAQGYANSFQRVYRRHGFDRLMTSLRTRAERGS
jgi:phospholipid transport system substrate-binding protein